MGSKLLKVIGILMIIFGAIAIVISLLAIGGVALISASLGGNIGLYWIAIILNIVGAVFEFVSGIIGVKNWDKPEKAKTCVILGIVCIAIPVISNIITLAVYSESFNVFSLIISLVVPVLYLIGAMQLKNKAE